MRRREIEMMAREGKANGKKGLVVWCADACAVNFLGLANRARLALIFFSLSLYITITLTLRLQSNIPILYFSMAQLASIRRLWTGKAEIQRKSPNVVGADLTSVHTCEGYRLELAKNKRKVQSPRCIG